MITKRLVLTFPEKTVNKPITYRLVKDYDLSFNILRAEITADIEGKILIEIKGSKEQLEEGIAYLQREGISTQDASRDIILDREKCVNCGVCPSLCIAGALEMDKTSLELIFDRNKCILCGLCEDACPVKAISLRI